MSNLARFRQAAEERLESIREDLAEGRIPDWATYQRKVGEYKGIKDFWSDVHSIQTSEEKDDV